MTKIKGKHLMALIAMCGLTASALGMLTNISGLFFTPIAEELSLGRGSVSATLTISNLVFALGGMLCARLVGPKSFKPMLIVGSGIFVLGTAGLAAASDLPMLYALNALRGLAAGLVGNVLATTVINNWFFAGAGLATSIAMGCSGIAGALLSPVLSAIIDGAGWRTGYLCAAGIIALFNLPAILLPISFRPEDCGLEPLGGKAKPGQSTRTAGGTLNLPLFGLALIYGGLAAYVTAIPQHFPGISESYGLGAATGSVMLSVCMVANTSGKIVFGLLADKLGTKLSVMLYSVLITAGAILMMLVHTSWMMLATAVLLGLGYSLATVGAVMVTKDLFGLERYSQVYPKVNLTITISNALGTSLAGFIYDASGTYTAALVLAAAMMLTNLAVVTAAYGKMKAR